MKNCYGVFFFFFFKQKTAYEITEGDWSSDVCSSDLGCSGFKYSLNIEDKPAEDDLVIETGGVRCFVDAFSAQYLNGVTLNYKSNFQESGFTFENPNATGGCGCGSSFTV